MTARNVKIRWRRRYRHSRHQVEDLGEHAEEQIERLFFRRLGRFVDVRRFIAAWVLLLVLLIGGLLLQIHSLSAYYQKVQPVDGGTYIEGIIGSFTNANPVFATGSVDASVSHLVFSSLFTFNGNGDLVGDLATRYSANEQGTLYSVMLKDGIRWHDGEAVTAADVAFTYHLIQNPDVRSPLAPSWQGVTVKAVDDHTVTFELPNALSAFPYSLTNGIVPEHILSTIPTAQLRSASFNTGAPIGSGPFKWDHIETSNESDLNARQQRILLLPNNHYFAGEPKLDRYIIRSFRTEDKMINALEAKELTAAAGLESLPVELEDEEDEWVQYSIPLNSGIYVFLKNSQPILADPKVRQALVQATDVPTILDGLGYPAVQLYGPLLRGHIGFDLGLKQLQFDIVHAQALLDEAGWTGRDENGIRKKGDTALRFSLSGSSTPEHVTVAQQLQKQWRLAGVDLTVDLQLSDKFQSSLAGHNYDALLYGIALGSDPDVFAFWHSSQADEKVANRLNFSEYKSSISDTALEAGRTRLDASIRTIKYKPFLESWRNEAPAVALYQPRFYYLAQTRISGLNVKVMTNPVERYYNVHNWMIRQRRTN